MKYKKILKDLTLIQKCSLLAGEGIFNTRKLEEQNVPPIIMSDGPHGLRKPVGASDHLGLNESQKSTCFPTAVGMASSWSEELCEKVGNALAVEARSQGVDVILGPGLNIKRSPLCGRNFEYFSEDPYLSGKLAGSMARGIESKGVGSCLKHFAVNSQESLRMLSDSIIDERALREIYLTGFEIAVKESKPHFVMSSYNKVNGVYANENKFLLEDILRGEWGFDGAVVSDWGGSNSHTDAVIAGSHLEMPFAGCDTIQELLDAVNSGELSHEILDKRVEEYLKTIFEIKEMQIGDVVCDHDKHHELAKTACEESAVLLKNIDNILPLKVGEKIAVIGEFADKPRYQGAGSSQVNPVKVTSFLDACELQNFDYIGFENGYTREKSKNESAEIEKAVILAKKADKVLLFVGLEEIMESEGFDRKHISMSISQNKLIEAIAKVNSNVICIVMAGSVIKMPWEPNCKGILNVNLTGQAGGEAILNLITGAVSPSGKLTETYIDDHNDSPCAAFYPGRERTSEYRDSIFVGYRYYETANEDVKFPFGFGLSYSNFEYSNLILSENKATFTIANTGKCTAKEIAQLYVSKTESDIFRAKIELKGFSKTTLKAGEKKQVEIAFDDKTFRYFNTKTGKFEIEAGEYKISIGASSKDIRLTENVSINGTTTVIPYEKAKLENYYACDIKDVGESEFEVLMGCPIPKNQWDTTIPLGRNDCLSQMGYAKSPLARFIYRRILAVKNKSEKKGKPNLNVHFLLHMPFRGIAKNSGGMASLEMTDAIIEMVNGHFFKGAAHLIRAKFRKGKLDKRINSEIKKSNKN